MTSRVFLAGWGWGSVYQPRAAAQQSAPLTVVQSGPTNEIQNLREANEIRIVFSEPMVALGRIPDPVTAPFVSIRPAIAGTFRWSGTTILIFTPDPSRKLPNATQYDVTVDTSAVAVSGRRLATAVPFHVHDADRQTAGPRLVSQEQALRQPDGARAAIQPAGSISRRRRAHQVSGSSRTRSTPRCCPTTRGRD